MKKVILFVLAIKGLLGRGYTKTDRNVALLFVYEEHPDWLDWIASNLVEPTFPMYLPEVRATILAGWRLSWSRRLEGLVGFLS